MINDSILIGVKFQVMHYGAGFAGQYSSGPVPSSGVSQYGGVGDPCYGGPGRTQPPPAPPACYRPPTTYRTPTRPGDAQVINIL